MNPTVTLHSVHNEPIAVRASSSVEPSVWLELPGSGPVLVRLEVLEDLLDAARRLVDDEA